MKVYKNIFNRLFFLAMLTAVVVACGEETDSGELINTQLTGETRVYLDPANASSVSETANVINSAGGSTSFTADNTVEIGIVRTGSNFDSDLTVQFEASVVYADTTDFYDAGDSADSTVTFSNEGSVVIPAGKTRGTIVVAVKDDVVATGDRTINVTLTGVSGATLGFSDSDPATSAVITIIDDDCPIDIAAWVGTYTVDENFTGGVNAPSGLSDFFGESYQVEIALDPTDNTGTKVLISTSAGFDPYFFPNDPLSMTFLTCPQQVKFSPEFPTVGFGFRSFVFETSTFNPSNFTIKCEGPLATFGPYQFTLTKQVQ